jgi:hypothetical protein
VSIIMCISHRFNNFNVRVDFDSHNHFKRKRFNICLRAVLLPIDAKKHVIRDYKTNMTACVEDNNTDIF